MRARLRRAVAALAAGLVLAALPASGQEEAPASPASPGQVRSKTWYAQTVGHGPRGAVVTHYWSKGANMRAEMVIGGHRIITLIHGEYYTILDSLEGTGVSIRRSPRAVRDDAGRIRPFGNELEQLKARGGEYIKDDTFAGRPTQVFRVTDGSGRHTVAIDLELGLPISVRHYLRQTGETEGVDYVNWLSGFAIPDGFFEVDPRFTVERIELDEYRSRIRKETVGPAPVMYRHLLYGERD